MIPRTKSFPLVRKNRQFRMEERDKEGNVHGQYGYINKKGALKIVKYTAGLDGYKVIQ